MRKQRMGFSVWMMVLGVALSSAGCQKIADRYIESYLDRNGPAVMQKLTNRQRQMDTQQQEAQFDAQLKSPVNLPLGDSPIIGNPNAPITIVEFSDFECPFCSRVVPTVKQLLQEYPGEIKIAFKHMPLPMHKNAPLASKATIAAQNQGKFWEMHDLIFENQREINEANVTKWAKSLKLDMGRFARDLKASATQARLDADMQLAGTVGARSTPTFFLQGAMVRGAQPIDAWKRYLAKVKLQKK